MILPDSRRAGVADSRIVITALARIRMFSLLAALALVAPGGAVATAAARPAAGQRTAAQVRFEYEDGRFYVPVRAVVRGKAVDLGWFVLDTGAAGVGMDAEVARRIGLAVKPTDAQTGAGAGASAAGLADGIPLHVDGVALTPASILVLPLDSLLAPSSGRHVAGIVGTQFFHEHTVEIDRSRNLLAVDPPHADTGADLPPAGRHAIPFSLDSGLPTIVATLAVPGADSAATSLRLVVDLGAKAPLLLTEPLLARLGGESRLGPRVLASLGAGAGGETRYYFTGVRDLRLGPEHAPVADTLVAGFSALGTLRSTDYEGLLGAPLLDHFAVLFDFARGRLWIAPRRDGLAAPVPLAAFDRAGLFLVARWERGVQHLVVRRVVAGSPAAEAQIAEGDEVTSVDGQGAATLKLSALRIALKDRHARPVRLGIRRGGATSVRVLALRDLF